MLYMYDKMCRCDVDSESWQTLCMVYNQEK